MNSYRLLVFQCVAKNLSFTKASQELFISQPAITAHIKELETEFNLRLFNRHGNRIQLTDAGKVLLDYVEKIFSIYRKLEFELSLFRSQQSGVLKIGACTTIAQYVIPPILTNFNKKFPKVKLSLQKGNSNQIIQMVLKGELDVGIVDGKFSQKELKHEHFISDEVVAVCGANSSLQDRKQLTLKELAKLPIVLRERGSGTLEGIEIEFRKKNIQLKSLNIQMSLGSTESLKSFIIASDAIGFIPMKAIKNEIFSGLLKIIKVKNFELFRSFDFIYQLGPEPEGLSRAFIEFAKNTSA